MRSAVQSPVYPPPTMQTSAVWSAGQRRGRPAVLGGQRLLEPERAVHGAGFSHSGRFAGEGTCGDRDGRRTGIGRAAALALTATVQHRRRRTAARAARGDARAGRRGLRRHPGDIREPEVSEALVERCLSEFGRIDCLVNNAGGQFVAPAEDITPNGWRGCAAAQPRRALAPDPARGDALDDRERRRPGDLGCPSRGAASRDCPLVGRAGRHESAHEHALAGMGEARDRAGLRRPGVDRHRGRARLRRGPR